MHKFSGSVGLKWGFSEAMSPNSILFVRVCLSVNGNFLSLSNKHILGVSWHILFYVGTAIFFSKLNDKFKVTRCPGAITRSRVVGDSASKSLCGKRVFGNKLNANPKQETHYEMR